MRKTTAIGASLLLAAGLATGLTAPAAAQTAPLPATGGWGGSYDDHWGDKSWGDGQWDDRVGGHWDGGSGYYDGKRYDWPEETRDYDANVCPDMDEAKTDVSGDKKTITLIAPEGKLISAYCVKAGSYKQGLGPKVVKVEPPTAEVTISYTYGGKCKDISHYSVAYVDAPQPTPSPSPSEATPSPSPSPSETPTDEETDEPETPVTTPETTPEPTPDTSDVPEESEVITAEPSPSASEAAPAADDNDDSEAGPVTSTIVEGAGTPAQASELAMTGPQVAALALAALALIGVGVGAVMAARRRRESQA